MFSLENIRVQISYFDRNKTTGTGFLSVLRALCKEMILNAKGNKDEHFASHPFKLTMSLKENPSEGLRKLLCTFYRPKQASMQGKVLGNGWISNREHFLWWPLAAPSVMGLFIFNCSTVVLVWERCSRELALPVLIYAWVCTLFFSCSSQRILWAITEWLKWVQILQASARRSLLLPSFLGKSCSSRFRQCAKRGTCVNWPFHTALTILSVIIKPRERQWGGGWATD